MFWPSTVSERMMREYCSIIHELNIEYVGEIPTKWSRRYDNRQISEAFEYTVHP